MTRVAPNPFQAWEKWFETPAGALLRDTEQAWLDARLQDRFGYQALQMGPVGVDALRQNRMACRARIAPFAALSDEEQLVCDPAALPVESDSTDLLVLVHCLEMVGDPHGLLREAERILIPEGQLVILGFNPFSLWAAHRPRAVTHCPPMEGKWLSPARVRDWCSLLGLSIDGGCFGLYRPMVYDAAWSQRWRWMDAAGARWWPGLGATYLLTAVKRRTGLRVLSPAWKKTSRRATSAAVARQS